MIIFFFILVILWLFSRYIKNWTVVLAIFIFFAILIGFRSISVGADTQTFARIYEWLGRKGYHGYPEILYGYMNICAYKLGLGYSGFLFCNALMFSVCSTIAICLSSPRRGYSIFAFFALYFVFYAMNISRQMTAVSVVFVAYALLYRRHRVWFILLVMVASLIHSSAFISLIALVCPYFNLNNKRVIAILLLGSIGLGLLLSDGLITSVTDRVLGDYSRYLHDEAGRNGFRDSSRVMLSVVLSIYWTSLFLFNYKYIQQRLRNNLWMKLYFIAVILINLTMRMELGIRVVLYFSIAEPIIFACFLSHNRLKFKAIANLTITTYLVIFFSVFLLNNSARVLPYNNLLFSVL